MNWEAWRDPSCAETMLVMYLYSIEPPFYGELNTASRDELWKQDPNILNTLGPFACALFWAVNAAQKKRDPPPILFPSLPHDNFRRAYNVFRGSKMMDEWVSKWSEAIGGDYFECPGLLSTSRDPAVAIHTFIGNLTDEDHKNGKEAFLWIFTVTSNVCLFSLDSSEYSAYPGEREVLLMEGREVYVLGREKIFSTRFGMSYNVFYCRTFL